jgi:hypothetical protein
VSTEAPGSSRGQAKAWGLLLPAVLWTVTFFAMPLVIMGLDRKSVV